MTAWVNYSDPLLVSIDQGIAGADFPDNRSIFFNLSNIAFSDGGITGSIWYQDNGPLGMDADLLEPRAFCTKGQASFSFTGRTLIVRLNVAFSWFTGATVTIDGVAPSTIGGVLTHTDTLSCDAATYQLFQDSFVNVVVADGLTNTAHAVVIRSNSSDPAKFFSIVGYKVGVFATQPITRNAGWLVPASATLTQNTTTVTLTNRGSGTIANISFGFPAGLVTSTNTALTTLTAATLGPGDSISRAILPVYTGDELSGTFPYNFALTAQYPDPDGVITNTIIETALVNNAVYTVTGTWFQDILTPDSSTRIYTASFGTGNAIQFTFVGDALTLVVQTSAGFSDIGIYASDNTTLLQTVTCNVDTGGALATHPLTGFGAGNHTVFLRKSINDSLFIVFVSAAWSVTENFTSISETVVVNYQSHQPVAMPVLGVTVGAFDVTFTPPVLNTQNFSGVPVRENTHLAYTEILTRFPTFAVCYQGGFFDTLSQYDILIVDPLGAHAADVLAWQAKGIKVFGYISSGEEVGFYANRYDFASALAPNSGAGPGGNAPYFMFTRDPDTPDKDGVWASYYINPDPDFGWPDRLEDYYAPQVFGGPVVVTNEVVTTKTVSITAGSVIVFDTAQSPIDSDQPIIVKTFDGSHTYTIYADYTFNVKTGAFVLSTAISPAVTSGDQLKISYTRKGHTMDGVFFDTVDTPDVYGSDAFGYEFVAGYAELFTDMINNFAANHSDAWIISNRGFTILPNIIQSCKGVMFESWLTLPTDINDLNNTDYERITDADTIAANDAVNLMLRQLRMAHEFDVYSLNYCTEGDDDLQAYCRAQDLAHGYLSWQTIITLNKPQPNNTVVLPKLVNPNPGLPVNAFTRYKTKAI